MSTKEIQSLLNRLAQIASESVGPECESHIEFHISPHASYAVVVDNEVGRIRFVLDSSELPA